MYNKSERGSEAQGKSWIEWLIKALFSESYSARIGWLEVRKALAVLLISCFLGVAFTIVVRIATIPGFQTIWGL
ncbi:hypothetical protein KKG41_02885 [Patescibacteria group bacterium]|nr:hypothetical protein [Patescibacteria group bacterium]MBU1890776.1 hypothetical protein [Patescibacteria group bacterium]